MSNDHSPAHDVPVTGLWLRAISLLSSGLTIYFVWSYSGPYRWLVEQQLAWNGSYDAKFTALLVWLALLLPLVVAVQVGRRLSQRMVGDEANTLDPFADAALRSGTATPAAPLEPATKSRRVYGQMWFVGPALMLWMIGGVYWYKYSTAGQLSQATIEGWDSGQRPDSRYVCLDGQALVPEAVAFGKGSRPDVFAPLVSANWRPGQPVNVFLKIQSRDARRGSWKVARQHQGLIDPFGVPGAVLALYEKSQIVPAKDCVLLDVGVTPGRNREVAIFSISMGFVLLAAQCVYSTICAARATPAEPALAESLS